MDIGLSFWLPGGGLAHLGGIKEQRVMVDDDLEVGAVRYERIAPLKQWRITANGDASTFDGTVPVACDVVFDALTPAMGGDGQGQEAADAQAAADATVGRQRASRTSRSLVGLDRGRRNAACAVG